MTRALFIEDNESDRLIASRLTRDGLETEGIHPPPTVEDLVTVLRNADYDLLLLDYRLDDAGTVPYRGGSAAAAVREALPEMPIGLITTETKLHEWVASNPQIRTLFDLEFLKGDLVTPAGRRNAISAMEGIVDAFAKLKLHERRPPADYLAVVLAADEREGAITSQLAPDVAGQSLPSVLRLIRTDLLEVDGPLLGTDETRVRLGLYPGDFGRDAIQNWLQPTRYEGILGDVWPRWWRGRVLTRLRSLGVGPDALAKERVAKLSQSIGVRLRSEGCVWCGDGQTARACSVCHRAVENRHSVEVRSSHVRDYTEPPVVCFLCIQEGRAERVTFVIGSESVITQLHDGTIARPVA